MCTPLPTAAHPPVGQGKALGLPITALRAVVPSGPKSQFNPTWYGRRVFPLKSRDRAPWGCQSFLLADTGQRLSLPAGPLFAAP